MMDGFKKELDGRLTTLKQCREALEALFAKRLDDEQIELPENSTYKQNVLIALRNCESGFNAYAGSVRSIKAVVETSLNQVKISILPGFSLNWKTDMVWNCLRQTLTLTLVQIICFPHGISQEPPKTTKPKKGKGGTPLAAEQGPKP